jgi:hypothetical protein
MPSPRTQRSKLLAAATLLLCLPLCSGCGVLALAHDKILGPISPAGRIHPLVVGDDFRVSENGPVADIVDPNPFRFYPPNPLKRLYRSPRTMLQGIQFFLGFVLRYALLRRDAIGQEVDYAAVEQLEALRTQEGATVSVSHVLDALGPPRKWFKRPGSQLMVYGSTARDELSFSLGLPPGVGNLLPIPGVGELLRFDYSHVTLDRQRTLLFLSPDDVLVGVVWPQPQPEDVE